MYPRVRFARSVRRTGVYHDDRLRVIVLSVWVRTLGVDRDLFRGDRKVLLSGHISRSSARRHFETGRREGLRRRMPGHRRRGLSRRLEVSESRAGRFGSASGV